MDYAGYYGFVVALAIIILSTTLYKRKSKTYKSSSLLPLGTFGWPIIGETFRFVSCGYSDNPHAFIHDRTRRYGKVFKSHLFGKRVIISTDAETNRRILQCDAKTFVSFMPKSVTDLLGKSSILVINGSMQRRLHGLIATFIKSPYLKAQFTLHYRNRLLESMATWKEDHTVHIQHEISIIAFHVFAKFLIDLDPGEEMDYLKVQLQELTAGFASLPINLPGSRFYKSLQAKKKMVEFVNKILEAKRDGRDYSRVVKGDLADVFLKDESDQKFSDEIICDNIVDLMVPAQDDLPILAALAIKYLSESSIALRKIMAYIISDGMSQAVKRIYMSRFQEENLKLKREKDEAKEPLSWSDYLSLPFTQCVISETLRMGNITSGVMREAVRDVEINGYFIPKGWCVMADFRSIHYDHNLYHDPHRFNPWRWQGKGIGNMISSSSFTPFSGGQRLCAGFELARLHTSIFLHHFVTNFRWVAEEDSIVSFPTGRMKRGMPVRVKWWAGL